MPRFFLDSFQGGDTACITGQDAAHITRSLRMRAGEALTLCDTHGTDYDCEIVETGDTVVLRVLGSRPTASEPSLQVTLYQALPKSDKLEHIIQKSVEMGVFAIVPVETARCIARLDDRIDKKLARWQKIAAEAAGQSGRGILPAVLPPLTFKQALAALHDSGEDVIVFYEGGGMPLCELVSPDTKRVSVFIGSEGGFAPEEIEALTAAGARTATLGPRILRCETAPTAALAALMLLSGNLQ